MAKNAICKKQLTKRYHKTSQYFTNGKHCCSYYSVVIPFVYQQIGLGDGLTNIMIEYSDVKMFGQPIIDSPTGYIGDKRPQIIIANHHNHNNTLPYVTTPDGTTECYEGAAFRRNINLERLSRKHVFLHTCKIIQDDLLTSLFARQLMQHGSSICINPSLFGYLPSEIVTLIVKQLQSIGLFNTYGINYINDPKDIYC